jgi:hypothetical protein
MYYEESLAVQYERSCRHRPGERPTVAHLEKALRQREAKLGKAHPEVARTLGCLAYLFANETRYLEALQLQQRGVDIEKASLGPAHADVALSYYRMSLYKQRLSLLGQIEDAIWLMGKAEAAAAAALPMGHVWQRTFALRTTRLKADLNARQSGATPEYWTTRSVPRYACRPALPCRPRTADRVRWAEAEERVRMLIDSYPVLSLRAGCPQEGSRAVWVVPSLQLLSEENPSVLSLSQPGGPPAMAALRGLRRVGASALLSPGVRHATL